MTSNRQKAKKIWKLSIACGFDGKCIRYSCPFKHPDGWDIAANIRHIQEEHRKYYDLINQHRREMGMRMCYNQDLCCQLDCPCQHPLGWDPVRNRQLAEEKCRHEIELTEVKRQRDEQQREQQQKHALDISLRDTIGGHHELDQNQSSVTAIQKTVLDKEYEYDNEHFDIQKKIWKKQSVRQTNYY
jgi:hypothetical protein